LKYKKTVFGIIVIIALLAILAMFGGMYSIPGQGEYGIDSMGNLITPGNSFFQAFSLYDLGGKEHECFVDDSRNAGCQVQETVLSVPAGSQIVHHIDKSVDYTGSGTGWEGYGSCAGFMAHYGCDSGECAYHNQGVCEGKVTDSSKIQCGTNSDCNNIGKTGYSCVYGTCWPSDFIESDSTYMCNRGQIYVNVAGTWKMFGSCMDKYSVAQCHDGKTSVYGDELRDICQADCTSDSDCKTGYVCQKVKYTISGSSKIEEGGRCIVKSSADKEDETFQRQEEILMALQIRSAECAMDGGEWTGTDCINEGEDELIDENIEEIVQEENIDDYILVTCTDGTELWYSDYEAGARCEGEKTPEPTTEPGEYDYGFQIKWGKVFAVFGVVIILGGMYVYLFNPFETKGRKRPKK